MFDGHATQDNSMDTRGASSRRVARRDEQLPPCQRFVAEGMRAYMTVRMDERLQIAQQWVDYDSGDRAFSAYCMAFEARHALYLAYAEAKRLAITSRHLAYDNATEDQLQPTQQMVAAYEEDPDHDVIDFYENKRFMAIRELVKR